MRIAILSDIHGNLTALEAVLADIEAARPDQIVCLGDVATPGPDPRGVIECLRDLQCPIAMGNADARLLEANAAVGVADNGTDVEPWVARQLGPDGLAFLSTFQPTVELPVGDDATLVGFHGIVLADNSVMNDGVVNVLLDPLGASGSHVVVLEAEDGHLLSVKFNALTGTVDFFPEIVGFARYD